MSLTYGFEQQDGTREETRRDGEEREVTGGPLRIALVAPPWFELPPTGYGGSETVVAALANELSAVGHHVVLIASGRNGTAAAEFHQVFATPPSELLGTPLPEVVAAARTAEILDDLDVDIVHDHSLAGPLLARGRRVPTVVTVHGPATGENGVYLERLGRSVDMVAISDSQRSLNPGLNWAGTVHNGVDVASFTFRERKDDYVLWLGRFSPDKGADVAIDSARAAGRRIVLAGKLNEAEERQYFEARVAPRLGRGVEWVGEADAALKRELLAGAACLSFPIQWHEPFGLVMIEALASGTPVVAYRRGSVPEVVDDGLTGVVVDPGDDFAAALDRAMAIRPADCRERALQRFDLPIMAAGYERIYRLLGEGSRGIRSILDRGEQGGAWEL